MKVKELKRKYKEYTIELYGRPLNKEMIPFSYLPIENLDEYEVKEINIIEQKHKIYSFNFNNKRKTDKAKGFIQAYIKKC